MEKIEIVVEKKHVPMVLDLIDSEFMLPCTLVDETKGYSFKTEPESLGVEKKGKNFISILCSARKKNILVQKIFPLITHAGGICIVYSNFVG